MLDYSQQFKNAKLYLHTEKGDFGMNPAWITPWTIIHFSVGVVAHGIAVYLKLKPWWAGFLWLNFIHLLYEIKDQTRAKYKNSMPNSIGDQIAAAAGYLFALWLLGDRNTPIVSLLVIVSAFLITTLMDATPIWKVQFW